MSASGREAALARLQERRQQLKRERALVKRQIVRVGRRVLAMEQQIVDPTPS